MSEARVSAYEGIDGRKRGCELELALCRPSEALAHFLGGRLHEHSFFELCFVTAGRIDLNLERGGKRVELRKGEAFWVKPGERHCESFETSDSVEVGWLGVEAKGMARDGLERMSMRKLHLGEFASELSLLVRGIFSEMESRAWGAPLMVSALLQSLVVRLARGEGRSEVAVRDGELKGKASERKVLSAAHFMRSQLDAATPVSEVAEMYHMSPEHFSRLFKQRFGVGPKQYQIGVRIEKARRLLKASDPVLKDVAQACGFHDEAHFSRAFKGVVGVTPSSFREIG